MVASFREQFLRNVRKRDKLAEIDEKAREAERLRLLELEGPPWTDSPMVSLFSLPLMSVSSISDDDPPIRVAAEMTGDMRRRALGEHLMAFPQVVPASYVVYKDGSVTYAFNAANGKIDYSSTDFSTVMNNVLAVASNGEKVLVKAGRHDVYTTIESVRAINIFGEGRATRFNSLIADGSDVISYSHVDQMFMVTFAEFQIIGNGSEGDGISFTVPVRQNLFSNLRITGVGGNGIHLIDGYDVRLEYCYISGCGENCIFTDDVNLIEIIGSTLLFSDKGFRMVNGTSCLLRGTEFGNNTSIEVEIYDSDAVNIIGNYFEAKTKGIVFTAQSGSTSKTGYIDGNFFNQSSGALYNVEIDHAEDITYGYGNRDVNTAASRFNITEFAGGTWTPIIIHQTAAVSNNSSDYLIHIRPKDGKYRILDEHTVEGVATVLSGQTSVTVNLSGQIKNFSGSPTYVQLTPQVAPVSGYATYWYWDTPVSGTFNVNIGPVDNRSGFTINYKAVYDP